MNQSSYFCGRKEQIATYIELGSRTEPNIGFEAVMDISAINKASQFARVLHF